MKYYLISVLALLSLIVKGQRSNLLIDQIQIKNLNGLVAYNVNDSLIFVFEAKNYLKIADFDSVPSIKSDSIDENNCQILIKTLNTAINNKCTLLSEVYYKKSIWFPNSYIMMELFSKHKIFVFQKRGDSIINLNYKIKTCRGRNTKGYFMVVESQTKVILYERHYGKIRN